MEYRYSVTTTINYTIYDDIACTISDIVTFGTVTAGNDGYDRDFDVHANTYSRKIRDRFLGF